MFKSEEIPADSISVSAVENKRELKRFIYLPKAIYWGKLYSGYAGGKRDPNWVPPLWMEDFGLLGTKKDPIHTHIRLKLFIAYCRGTAVGRVAAVYDQKFIDCKKTKTGYFSFFESVDLKAVAGKLLEAAGEWLRAQGIEEMIGPCHPSLNQSVGMLARNFTVPPVVNSPYNPSYYLDFFTEELGWKVRRKFRAYLLDSQKMDFPEKMIRIAKMAKEKTEREGHVEIRPIDLKHFERDLVHLYQIYNDAWGDADYYEFLPWDWDEFAYAAHKMKMVAEKRLAQIAFVDGEPAGFVLPLIDINEVMINSSGHLTPILLARLMRLHKRAKGMRIAILGFRPQFHKLGLEAIILVDLYLKALEIGYQRADMSFITEGRGHLVRFLDNLGFENYRGCDLFEKKL